MDYLIKVLVVSLIGIATYTIKDVQNPIIIGQQPINEVSSIDPIKLNVDRLELTKYDKAVKATSKPIKHERNESKRDKTQVSGSEYDAKMFIYQKESGNNPAAVNPTGCRGLGQACPGTKLTCGNDYSCQDKWFTNYMRQRYGSWTNAKAHWLARVPINGVDVGHWW